jgi:hypothetical protein
MTRVKFATEMTHLAKQPNDKVVADVCGPVFTRKCQDGSEEKCYLSTVIDVYSRHLHALLIHSKDQASDHVISYFHSARILTGNDLRHFHTDGGTEYNRAEKVLEMRGTRCTRTPVSTPQRNAIAERKNRTILEMARSLLRHARLPWSRFWREAIETAVYVHNRVTVVEAHGKTIHELYSGNRPDLSALRVFGCDAFVRIPGQADRRDKGAPRSVKGIFLGYDTKRELCYRVRIVVEGGPQVVVSRDVIFRETQFTVEREELRAAGGAGSEEDRSPAAGLAAKKSGDSVEMSDVEREDTLEPVAAKGVRGVREEKGRKCLRELLPVAVNRARKRHRGVSEYRGPRDDSLDPKGPELDRRTKAKIEAAQLREEVAARPFRHHGSTHAQSRLRRSARDKRRAPRTGLNLDDFGAVALQTSLAAPGSSRAGAVVSVLPVCESPAPDADSPTSTLPLLLQTEVVIPSTRRAALRSPYARYWQEAMDREHESLQAHGTYELVPRPADARNIVSCKWVFDTKCKDGRVVRFKARLVARGYSQQFGIDYDETYSPVLKYKTLRIVLAIVAIRDYELELMDVQTAYLNADLRETVYMQQPEGYERGPGSAVGATVCLLRKALYGLKQAGREWNIHLDAFVRSLGFTRCVSDTCVYVRQSRTGRLMILSVYVDDIPSAFAPQDAQEWAGLKQLFFRRFKISFLGAADWLLNMRITRDRKRRILILDQRAYVDNLLEELRMDECKPASHPGSQDALSKQHAPATPEEAEEMRRLPYRRAIGLLTYLANTSRPDVAHAVNRVAQFSQNPGPAHWRAVKQILRYLCGTSQLGLKFDGSGKNGTVSMDAGLPPLVSFADSDWAGCPDTRRSTTGWLLCLGGCLIDWHCQKQPTVALSSCEAEYMALSSAVQGVMWTRKLLGELGLTDSESSSTLLHSDNKSAVAMARNDVLHNRSKHIDIRYHFIREEITAGRIHLQWIPTEEQRADILTKALPPRAFLKFRDLLVSPRPV